MDFDAFLAPLGADRFMTDYWDRRPVHVPADPVNPRGVLDWTRLNALLALRSHWTPPHIELVMNSRPVERSYYMEEDGATGVLRADPARVGAFLTMGASLVANAVEEIAPEVRRLTDMLAATLAGLPGANLYCSFKGVQAFASHYDTHEVFALHCEGEKTWRIYRNRADAPLDPILGGEAAQRRIDAMKGPVELEVTMRPGDLLYIPRGYFHDALASGEASLHLTLAVAPHSGRLLLQRLEQAALRDPAFRRYLPDGREGGAQELRSHVEALAERIGAILRSPDFQTELVDAQRRFIRHDRSVTLPARPKLEAFARTDRPAAVVRRPAGMAVQVAGGAEIGIGRLSEEAEWVIERPAVVVQELLARYPHRSEEELRGLLSAFVDAGLLVAYQPRI